MTNISKSTRGKKAKFWQGHIDGWKNSGQSQREYCQRNGLAPATFSYWQRKLRAESSPATRFYPLAVPDDLAKGKIPHKDSPLRLVIGDRRFTIEIDEQFSSLALQRLVIALEQL